MAPPWPNRPIIPSQSDTHLLPPPVHRPRTNSPHAPPRRSGRIPSRFDGFHVLNGSQIHADSSSSDDDVHPRRPQRPQHSRSVSNPFPSLFAGRKKHKSTARDESESDSAWEGRRMVKNKDKSPAGSQAPGLQQPSGQAHHGTYNGGAPGSKEFTTGNCMTCGSLVRWPRDLKVFKCTICQTINDLQLHIPEARQEGNTRRTQDQDGCPGGIEMSTLSFKPISVGHTRDLIRQCIQSFLSSKAALRATHLPEDSLGLTVHEGQIPESFYGKIGKVEGPVSIIPIISKSIWNAGETPPDHPASLLTNGPADHANASPASQLSPRPYSTSYPERRPGISRLLAEPAGDDNQKVVEPESRRIFKPLEDYVIASFSSVLCVNVSFVDRYASVGSRAQPAEESRRYTPESRRERGLSEPVIPEFDAKTLLVGDIAENGTWWTGGQEDANSTRVQSQKTMDVASLVTNKTAHIDWAAVDDWFSMVVNCGETWPAIYDQLAKNQPFPSMSDADLQLWEEQILHAQDHTQRVLLKVTEMLLKRPGLPMSEPRDIRFLLILLANPLIHASCRTWEGIYTHPIKSAALPHDLREGTGRSGPASGKHSGIIKRVLGLISNSSPDCQNHLIAWLARYPEPRFIQAKDLVGGFLAYRLIRQNAKKQEVNVDPTNGLIPNMSTGRTAASLHAALGQAPGSSKKPNEPPKKVLYHDDWQIKAVARVMAFIFAANNAGLLRRHGYGHSVLDGDTLGYNNKDRVHARGQILPTSDFYTTLLDESDLIADFEAWEHRRSKFSFCQYPFLLSIWAKIQILEYDAKRQMQNKARDAFFDSILSRRTINQYLVLKVRRECLVEDSLKAVSEVIGSGGEDIKKGLRIIFRGEEGIDAGGLRKEWFLMLVREVFNPDHGMFVYDDDSQFCYFNPHSFETSDQFFLVGVVMGLAIYNSTILDVALPPFVFRKLLHAAPVPVGSVPTHPRPAMSYSLDDLAEYRPRLAKGLRQLLEYEGDVESTFSQDFVVDIAKYGSVEHVPLCPGGDKRPVTNANRRDYVDLYVRYLLDVAVARQFEPFKRGFFTVCGSNALSLFRPEEIELLVRGSDEALDIASLRVAADYDNWPTRDPETTEPTEPTVAWFWESLEQATPQNQRKLLLFITGSDRIPAMGAASLSIRIVCLGEDEGRYPTARTCFNTLALWRYKTRERLEAMLWGAVHESEGFGLK